MNRIKLTDLGLEETDLLFPERWVESIGGKKKARELFLDIVERYFREEYFDPEILEAEDES